MALCFTSAPGITFLSHAPWGLVTQVYAAWLPLHSSFTSRTTGCHMLLWAKAAFMVGHGESNGTNMEMGSVLLVEMSISLVLLCFVFFLTQR